MSAEPSISVIVPAYNCRRWIGESVASALRQTLPPAEVIVIDDGSTDGTGEAAASLGPLVRVVRQGNAGVAAARNRGMALARGELIAFLDADDLWMPEKLAKQAGLLQARPDLGLAYCDSTFIDAAGAPIEGYVRATRAHDGDAAIELFCDHFLMTPAVLFRRGLLRAAGVFDEALRVGEDYDFFLRLLGACSIGYVPEKLWARRVLLGSLSRESFVLDAKTDLATLEKYAAERPDFARRHAQRIHRRLGDYRFTFGYRCLEEGMRAEAARQLRAALKHEKSWRVMKNLALCALPAGWRAALKGARSKNR